MVCLSLDCTPPSPDPNCVDDPPNWYDSYGDGCDWYVTGNNCALYGSDFESPDFGTTAIEACCICGGGAQPPRPRPPTHRRPILLLRIHVTPVPVRTEVSVAAQDQDTLASVLVLASPAPIVRPTSTIARRRLVPMVVLVSMV